MSHNAAKLMELIAARSGAFSPFTYDSPFASRRRDCNIHSPMLFFKKRQVPNAPPSLVKLCKRAFSLQSGSSRSAPSSDQVPELSTRDFSPGRMGAARKADAVSWVAGSTTCTRCPSKPTSRFTDGSKSPSTVPGWLMGPKSPSGRENDRKRDVSQVFSFAPTKDVVVALVYSQAIWPVRQ